MNKSKKTDNLAIILIFWSIINFLMFFLVYIGKGTFFVISGYKLIFTFNQEFFITILAVMQIVFTIIILGMLVLGILFLLNINNIKQNSSVINYANIFRVLPFLVISFNIIFIAAMVIGIEISESLHEYDFNFFPWWIGSGVFINLIINFLISIIFIKFSKKLLKPNM